jgi:hypothetical protein
MLRTPTCYDITCTDLSKKGATIPRLNYHIKLWSSLYLEERNFDPKDLRYTGRKEENGLFPNKFFSCYMHIVTYHAVDIIKEHPSHSIGNHFIYIAVFNFFLGLHQQQSFEANNSLMKCVLNLLTYLLLRTIWTKQTTRGGFFQYWEEQALLALYRPKYLLYKMKNSYLFSWFGKRQFRLVYSLFTINSF